MRTSRTRRWHGPVLAVAAVAVGFSVPGPGHLLNHARAADHASPTAIASRHHAASRPPSASGVQLAGGAVPEPNRVVHRGEEIILSGSGFAPDAAISISFHSVAPIIVGSARATNSGQFTAAVAVPADAGAGTHHFDESGKGATGQIEVLDTAVQVVAVTPPKSGHGAVTLIMVGLAVLIPLTTWLVLSLHSWRRRDHPAGD